MNNTKPKVSIISVNYNNLSDTLELIQSIFEINYTNWELFIVDNNSLINPKDKINAQYPSVKVIVNSKNEGFAAGNNKAIPHCTGDYILFINNDAILPRESLNKLVNTAQKTKNLGALSPLIKNYNNRNIIEFAGYTQINPWTGRNKSIGYGDIDRGQYSGLFESAYTHGGAMLVPRDVINHVSTMDSSYFLYYEEMDWCERMRRYNYKIYCDRDTIIYHKESATTGINSPLKTYYLNRNRIKFIYKNFKLIHRIYFTIYLCTISIPKNVVGLISKGRISHLKVYFKAILGMPK